MVSGLCGGEGLDDFGGLADIAPAREVPGVGKATALVGFDGLDLAILTFEEDAGAIGLIDEGEATSVGAEAGVFFDEEVLFHFEERGDGADFGIADFDIARPAAAVGASFAKVFGGFFQIKILRGGSLRGDLCDGEKIVRRARDLWRCRRE